MENKNKMGKDQAKKNKKPAPQKANYPIILAKGKGKLHLSKRLMSQINLLHDYAGSVEWSGPLFYNVKKGSILKPEELEIEAHAMYPMDIGTSGYTEYDFEAEQTFDMHDYYPEILDKGWDMGHMHTHHNMNAYFSGTDEQELKDNTPNHAYYLSLIVNFAKKYVARLCVMGTRKVSGQSSVAYKGLDEKDATNISNIGYEQEVVYAIDLDVTFDDDQIPFMKEVSKIKARKREQEKLRRDSRQAMHKEAMGMRYNRLDTPRFSEVKSWNESFNLPGQTSMFDDNKFDPYSNFMPDEELAKDFCYKVLSNDLEAVGDFRTLLADLERQYIEAGVNGQEDLFEEIMEEQIAGIFTLAYKAVYRGIDDYYYDNMQEVFNFLNGYIRDYSVAEWFLDSLMMYQTPEEDIENDDLPDFTDQINMFT